MTKANAVFVLLAILIAESCGNPHQAIAVQLNPQERTFRKWDKNGDGVLLRSEVPEGLRRMFGRVDRNQDGKVTLAEHMAATSGKKKDTALRWVGRTESPCHPSGMEPRAARI